MKIWPLHSNTTNNKIILWFKTFHSFSDLSINMSAVSWIFYGPLRVPEGSEIAIEVKIIPKWHPTGPPPLVSDRPDISGGFKLYAPPLTTKNAELSGGGHTVTTFLLGILCIKIFQPPKIRGGGIQMGGGIQFESPWYPMPFRWALVSADDNRGSFTPMFRSKNFFQLPETPIFEHVFCFTLFSGSSAAQFRQGGNVANQKCVQKSVFLAIGKSFCFWTSK